MTDQSDPTSSDEFPAPAHPVDESARAATPTNEGPATEAPTLETPGGSGTPPVAPSAPPPPGAPSASASAAPRRRGIFVPMWLLAALAGAILLGLGLVAGYAVVSDGHGERGVGERGAESRRQGRSNRDSDNGAGSVQPGPDRRIVPPGNPARPGVFLGVAVANSANPPGASLVQVVASSPAAIAGLQVGDVITGIDGQPVGNAAALTSLVRSRAAGDALKIDYSRAGATQTATATLSGGVPAPQQ